jgi:release factor glutamine methyltransferase
MSNTLKPSEKLPEPVIPLDSSDFQNVYEPAEDSFLFMDALEKDLPFLRKLDPTIVLELG